VLPAAARRPCGPGSEQGRRAQRTAQSRRPPAAAPRAAAPPATHSTHSRRCTGQIRQAQAGSLGETSNSPGTAQGRPAPACHGYPLQRAPWRAGRRPRRAARAAPGLQSLRYGGLAAADAARTGRAGCTEPAGRGQGARVTRGSGGPAATGTARAGRAGCTEPAGARGRAGGSGESRGSADASSAHEGSCTAVLGHRKPRRGSLRAASNWSEPGGPRCLPGTRLQSH
jgi:hypothetical protein